MRLAPVFCFVALFVQLALRFGQLANRSMAHRFLLHFLSHKNTNAFPSVHCFSRPG